MTPADLTPRQREVAELVGQGLSRAAIAQRLSKGGCPKMSVRTVDAHVRAIALRLPEDDLPAYRRVRRWTNDHNRSEVRHAL